ncbi:MAG: FAD-binding protein, partial [Vicinamibacterales bacterium]
YLSLRHLDPAFVHARFPLIADACRRAGLDLARDRIPVGPAAHYVMGGVWTDLDARTSVPGLFAAGEAACTGVHGANRLASNSLLEGLVFGARAGLAMRHWVEGGSGRWRVEAPTLPVRARDEAWSGAVLTPTPPASDVRDLLWRLVGLFRDGAGLDRAAATLDEAWVTTCAALGDGGRVDAAGWRALTILTVGRLIARAARRRDESRGAHFRTDFPSRDDIHWKRHVSETIEAATSEP